jgi:N-acetylneuraminic acid mutarotase
VLPSETEPAQPIRLHARVVGRLSQPVTRAVAVLASSRVVVLGGLTTGDVTTGRMVTINPRRWASAADGQLREPVHDASGAWLAGHAVVFGGGAATEVANTQQRTGATSRILGALPAPRSDSAAVTIGSTAYVIGGFDGSHMTRAVEATHTGRTFRTVARLRQGVRYPAVAALGDAIYVFGGQLATTEGTSSGGQSRLVQRVDPATGGTRVVGKLAWGIGHAMAFTIGGRLYLAGGRRGTKATARVWQVNPATAHLTPAGRLPHPISDCAVVNVGGSVVLIGGETTGPFAPQPTIVAVTAG